MINNMDFIQINNKKQLNDFVRAQKHSQILQSWEWGEFQKKNGNKIVRYGIYDENKIILATTLIKNNLFFGKSYFYCPRGPVINQSLIIDYESRIKILKFLFSEIKKIVKKENAIFLRFDPLFQIPNSKFQIDKTINIQASKTLILDIARSENKMLNDMHHKTRYNIRLANKKGVKIIEVGTKNFSSNFEEFWKIMQETQKRDCFRLHFKNYYKKMIEQENIKLLIAKFNGKIIAGVIISFFGDMGIYIHGASSSICRNIMAPYLLQWEAIKIAKNKKCKYYDFNGIDEKKWAGVTRFKRGFGGKEIGYSGTYDLVFDHKYYFIYKLLRKIRRLV